MIPTREQIEFRDLARRFARDRLKPGYQARERHGTLDRDLLRQMGSLGLIGVDLPIEHGGLGADGVTAGIVLEEIAYADVNVAYVQLLASLLGSLIARFAHPSIAQSWLPRIVGGETVVGLGLTEPRGGSDAANLILRAERQGECYILNGEKTSISFADQAAALIIFARTGPRDSGARGVSAFFADAGTAGITRTRFDDVGSRIVGRGSVFFDNVRLSPECLMGRENGGFSQVMQGFDYSRALIGLQCVAAAQASLDETWDYIKQREAFGVPIAQYQGVSFPLAEGETMLEAARQLSYHALALRDRGERHTAEAAMCKWLAPKTAVDVIHQCLLTHGHYGWTMDLPHQQRLRDVMGLEIGDGTAQIMKLVIARERVGHIAVQHAHRGAR